MLEIRTVFIALLAALPLVAFAAPAKQPISLTAKMAQPVCSEAQAVYLTLALHNNSKQSFIIGGSAFEQSSFQISIVDAKGRKVPRTAYGDRVLTPPTAVFRNMMIVLEPGASHEYHYDLAQLFDLSHPGKYNVSVSRHLRLSTTARQPRKTPPKEITLSAGPLPVRMVANKSALSGPTDLAPQMSRQTSRLATSVSTGSANRCRISGNGCAQ